MPSLKIGTRTVDAIKASDNPTLHWDTELHGFGVRVQPGGRKMFIAQFRRHGKTKRVSIGEYG